MPDCIGDSKQLKKMLEENQSLVEQANEIISGDVTVLAFPLYADSPPSNILKMIIELEKLFNEKSINKIIV